MPNRFHSIILILLILSSLVACTNNMSTDQSTDKLETQRDFDNREKVGLTISAAASLKDAHGGYSTFISRETSRSRS